MVQSKHTAAHAWSSVKSKRGKTTITHNPNTNLNYLAGAFLFFSLPAPLAGAGDSSGSAFAAGPLGWRARAFAFDLALAFSSGSVGAFGVKGLQRTPQFTNVLEHVLDHLLQSNGFKRFSFDRLKLRRWYPKKFL